MPAASNYIEMVFWLSLVLTIIFGLSWLMKKYSFLQPGLNGAISIQAATSLGNRDRLALIEVEGERVLIAISPGRISKLHVLNPSSFEATLQKAASQQSEQPDDEISMSSSGGLANNA